MKEKGLLPAIKVYEIDYEFILKNYTSPSLWDKKWTIFVFKNYVFELSLYSIDVKSKQISFEIGLNSGLDIWNRNIKQTFRYDLRNMTIEFLKKLILDNMLRLIESLEKNYITIKDKDYLNVEEMINDERESLIEIASRFLDDNGVYNEEIRGVYIDYYVDKNESIFSYRSAILENKKYTYLTDLYLIFAEVSKNDALKDRVIKNQDKDISEMLEKIEEFKKYLESDEYIEDMESKLESI